MIFYLAGEGGTGKTHSLASLCSEWAENDEELNHVDLMFLLQLRYVSEDLPLEQIIVQQHEKLRANEIKEEDLGIVMKGLVGERKPQVVVLVDGFDEYTPGVNKDIDTLLKYPPANVQLIVTSRPESSVKEILPYMDGQLHITGFNTANQANCIELYLGKENVPHFFQHVIKCGLRHRLQKPFVLEILCILYRENQPLHGGSGTESELIEKFLKLYVSKTPIKARGRAANKMTQLHELLLRLGKLAWEALQRPSQQLLFTRVRDLSLVDI